MSSAVQYTTVPMPSVRTNPGAIVAPAFAPYPLAEWYTAWLYGDESGNPETHDQPDKWLKSGMVQFLDRTIEMTVPTGTGDVPFLAASTIDDDFFNLCGGQHCIVFARYARAAVAAAPAAVGTVSVLKNQVLQYVWVRQRLMEGSQIDIADTPIINVFGTEQAPATFPQPVMWDDALQRLLSVSNLSGAQLLVRLTWKIAILNTGGR